MTVVVTVLRRWQDHSFRRVALKFSLAIAVVPVLWLAYNGVVYGNPLEFANGPYSAKAIEQRVGAPNPSLHSPAVAALYFMKSAQLNMADGNWGRFWLLAALLALAIAACRLRTALAPVLLLSVPLVFYALSIAYGSVPVHVHTWWPFATFNQRYGLQMLPMFAVSAGMLAGVRHYRARTPFRETGRAYRGADGVQLRFGMGPRSAVPAGGAEKLGYPPQSQCSRPTCGSKACRQTLRF